MHLLIVNNSKAEYDYSILEKYGTVSYIHCNDLIKTNFDSLLHNKTAVLLTGGNQHIPDLDKYEELHVELAFLTAAIERRLLIIGICLGFQLINHYFGNRITTLPVPVVGHDFLDPLSFNPGNDPRLQTMDRKLLSAAFSFHYDGVLSCYSDELIVVARSIPIYGAPYGIPYFVRHRSLPVYGIQSHPDGCCKSLAKCLEIHGVRGITLLDSYVPIFDNFFQILES
jgi:anthranilate/para-aminobenzoate synthase component II